VLAAAAGLGTITVVRGPAGSAAKILVACAVRILSSSQAESVGRQSPRPRRGAGAAAEAPVRWLSGGATGS